MKKGIHIATKYMTPYYFLWDHVQNDLPKITKFNFYNKP